MVDLNKYIADNYIKRLLKSYDDGFISADILYECIENVYKNIRSDSDIDAIEMIDMLIKLIPKGPLNDGIINVDDIMMPVFVNPIDLSKVYNRRFDYDNCHGIFSLSSGDDLDFIQQALEKPIVDKLTNKDNEDVISDSSV